jgi:ATP-binding cassette subfamily B protein
MRPTEFRDCGAAAFASVAAAAGHHLTVEEARDLVRTDNTGTHLLGLVQGGREIGLDSQAAMSDYDGLATIDGWAILHTNPSEGHFVVLLQWTRRGLWVMDPNRGRVFVTRDEYQRDTSHYAVVYHPTAAVRQRRSPIEPRREARALIAREAGWSVATIACAAAGAGLVLASPLLLGRVLDRVLPQGDSGTLMVFGIAMLALGLVQAVLALARVAGEGAVQRRISRRVGEKMLRHFSHLPQAAFDTRCTAGFVLRVATANDVGRALGPEIVALCADAGMAGFALALVFSRNVGLGLAVTAALPLSWAIWTLTRRRSTKAQHHLWMATDRFSSRLVDTFVELRSVRLAGSSDRFVESLVGDFDSFTASQRAQRVAQAVPLALSTMLFASLTGLVMWWLGANVIAGQATIGDLVLVAGVVALFFGPAQQFPTHLSNLTVAIDSVRRVEEVLHRQGETDNGNHDRTWVADGSIELRNVTFDRGGRSRALDGVSLRIEPGEVVAFVGETGAGKTSIANLVCGFYQPDAGELLLGGRSHADTNLTDWRRQVAAVFQDSGLLQRSVRDNVTMLHNFEDDQILDALEAAQARDFVARLRSGLDSQVARGGDNFSAGQAQRLALARAVLRDTPVLVLDEATSNLDSATEREVMDSVLQRRQGKTTLLFGHRLSALRAADRIYVLAGGQIVESGPLEQLAEQNGEFVRLFRSQLAGHLVEGRRQVPPASGLSSIRPAGSGRIQA